MKRAPLIIGCAVANIMAEWWFPIKVYTDLFRLLLLWLCFGWQIAVITFSPLSLLLITLIR